MNITAGARLEAKLLAALSIYSLCWLLLLLLAPKATKATSADHCYADLGCFPQSPEFFHPKHRPINLRPWHRSRVRVEFFLFSRDHPEGFQLRPRNPENLRHSHFNPKLETKIIVPGWLDNLRRALWSRRMRDAFLWLWAPANIIVVHWRNFTPYTMATANSRLVGAELANLIAWIEQETGYQRHHYHLIGHSLGAHISGYAGDRIPGLGRITALDPARPFFQHMPKSVRLDRGDASFVDAIHSDFTPENAIGLLMSFGMTTPIGHLDFYPNGPPLLQPGCLRDTITSLRDGARRGRQHQSLSVAFLESVRYMTACDHQRSHEWFTESITNRKCTFVGVRCNQFEGIINGRCSCDDSASACAIMGVHADQMYKVGLHDDIWPRGPATSALDKASMGKEEIYAVLREEARRMRNPTAAGGAGKAELFPELELLTKLAEFKTNRLEENTITARSSIEEINVELPPLLDTLFDVNPNSQALAPAKPINSGLPKLMSDFDRDIENWYEETSRWYLKTNSRPSYCVNQYQIQVFVGPLRSTAGRASLRANLLLSIIGSRGQLINQRFVPRATTIDSYTMQPFFILLEGSYSLGQIVSVAIGWEARLDPELTQATVSFKSNLLDYMTPLQQTAKHPWLSETLNFDYSSAFRWALPAPGNRLERRSMKQVPEAAVADAAEQEKGCETRESSRSHLLYGRQANLFEPGDELGDRSDPAPAPTPQPPPTIDGYEALHKHNEMLQALDGHLDNEIKLSLNNVPLHQSPDHEDSLVIRQVIVKPLQANYNLRHTHKLNRLFCPPVPNLTLRRDETIRLKPSLLGRCK